MRGCHGPAIHAVTADMAKSGQARLGVQRVPGKAHRLHQDIGLLNARRVILDHGAGKLAEDKAIEGGGLLGPLIV
jgi:hypothetical protein